MNKVERPSKTMLTEYQIQTIFQNIDDFQPPLETTEYNENLLYII